MLAVNVIVNLRRKLSKLNEAMMFESSVAENKRNKELVSQMAILEKIQIKFHQRMTTLVCHSRKRSEN